LFEQPLIKPGERWSGDSADCCGRGAENRACTLGKRKYTFLVNANLVKGHSNDRTASAQNPPEECRGGRERRIPAQNMTQVSRLHKWGE